MYCKYNLKFFNFCIQNETDTVEQPRRKEYKEAAFKQSASDRRLYDRRNLEALDKKVRLCSITGSITGQGY